MEKQILIHYHIFKNAGTSFDRALEKVFGSAWTSFEGTHAEDIKSAADLREFLSDRPDISAVSSHLARPPLPFPNSLPVVFIRHPILRAKSVYDFMRTDASQPQHQLAKENSLRDFILEMLNKEDFGVVLKNYQVIHLSDASFRNESIQRVQACHEDFIQAQNLLFKWPAFGIVEFYEQSLDVFNTLYKTLFGQNVLESHLLNSSRPTSNFDLNVSTQLDLIRDSIGPNVYSCLEEANEYDLRLYHSCLANFGMLYKRTMGEDLDL
jgi:hypothetical protein